MQKTKFLLLKFAFLMCSLPALAQGGGTVTVSGVVTSAEDKQPLIGVHVISGNNSGVSTLVDGSYVIAVTPGKKSFQKTTSPVRQGVESAGAMR